MKSSIKTSKAAQLRHALQKTSRQLQALQIQENALTTALEANTLQCRLGEGARKAVKGWGLELLCKEPRWRSDCLTVIETPKVVRVLV